jgi:hypothetical protein
MIKSLPEVLTALPPAARALYVRAGAWAPRTLDLGVATALLYSGPQAAESQLHVLEQAGLLPSVGNGQWRRTDAVYINQRDLARAQLAGARFDAVVRHAADYLLARVTAACDVLAPGRPRLHRYDPAYEPQDLPAPADDNAARAWLTEHVDTVVTVAISASDTGQHALCWTLLDRLWPITEHTIDQRYLDIITPSLHAAHLSGDPVLIADATLRSGIWWLHQDQHAIAEQHLSTAQQLWAQAELAGAVEPDIAIRCRLWATEQLGLAQLAAGHTTDSAPGRQAALAQHARTGGA